MNLAWILLPLAVLAKLAHDDLRHRRLANRWVVGYAMLFLPAAWRAGFDVGQGGGHLLLAALAFLILLGLFVLGVMGGGDVKLGTAVMLWAGPAHALPVTAVIAWIGGVMAVVGWLADRSTRVRGAGDGIGTIQAALSARRGVPYGVALAGGGMWVLWRYFVGGE